MISVIEITKAARFLSLISDSFKGDAFRSDLSRRALSTAFVKLSRCREHCFIHMLSTKKGQGKLSSSPLGKNSQTTLLGSNRALIVYCIGDIT